MFIDDCIFAFNNFIDDAAYDWLIMVFYRIDSCFCYSGSYTKRLILSVHMVFT